MRKPSLTTAQRAHDLAHWLQSNGCTVSIVPPTDSDDPPTFTIHYTLAHDTKPQPSATVTLLSDGNSSIIFPRGSQQSIVNCYLTRKPRS